MGPLSKKPDTLAIIGNGFDMAHGYKTDYASFAENTVSEYLEKFKAYCAHENITTWYLFEDNIRLITERLFMMSMTEACDFDGNRRETESLTEVFNEIHKLLMRYLAKEIASKPFSKRHSIEEYIGSSAVAINFNYTNTAEKYLKTVFYVHGSLEENDIVLGYDYRDEPCLAQFEDMRWAKNICRESLAFRRFFLQRKHLHPDSERYRELLRGLEGYQHWENTGRGLDDEVQSFIPQYRAIHKFLKRHRSKSSFPEINYRAIKTVVVLGHGIEADKVYLRGLLDRCERLSRIVIFRYAGEAEESYQNKCSFFEPYCTSIEQAFY